MNRWILSKRCLAAAALALLVCATARAGPVIIYDSGRTRSITPYLESLRGEDPPPDTRPPPSGEAGLIVEDLLPVETPGMSPGPMQRHALVLPNRTTSHAVGARPLFLIGSDPLSRRWLLQHRARLKEIGAVGMLVQAGTIEDLRSIARIADGLRIMPASGTEIARLYSIKHYPVLIWDGRIEQ